MSLYNLLNGINPSTFLFLPMLEKKHYSEYPRFRDCFVRNDELVILTRVGGENRNQGFGEDSLYKHPNFLRTEDCDFDCTYGRYFFSIPNEWRNDYDKIMSNDLMNISEEYKARLCSIYPFFSKIFYS